MLVKIYCLRGENRYMRYIGYTKFSLEKRLKEHLYEALHGGRGHRCNGIRALLRQGFLPTIDLITEVKNGPGAEILFIKYFRGLGVDLWNETDGGDGIVNPSEDVRRKQSLATKRQMAQPGMRQKLSTAAKKRCADPMWHVRISLIRKGRRDSPETKLKKSIAQRKRLPPTTKTRIKISLNNKGKHYDGRGRPKSEEHKRKIGLGLLGHHHSEVTKKQIGIKNTNPSFETRAKMSIEAKRRGGFSPQARLARRLARYKT